MRVRTPPYTPQNTFCLPHGLPPWQEELVLYGVDVTGSDFLTRPAVRRAVEFAAAAHAGQVRKTGEPYVAHCIETALIVEDLLSATEDDLR